MESPELNYDPSLDAAAMRMEQRPTSPTPDDKDKQTHLRFLVSNTGAGCIIGKGGSTINDIQLESGARIQLSRNHEIFPGTSERVIMVSGLFDEVTKAMELILERLLNEVEDYVDVTGKSKLRLIVPNGSCGGIIGKGGATIKSFIEESGAAIKISPLDHNNMGLNDRLVSLAGSLEELMQAIRLILLKLKEDNHYPPTLSSPFPYSGLKFHGYPGSPMGYGGPPVAYGAMSGQNGYGRNYARNKVQSNLEHSQFAPTLIDIDFSGRRQGAGSPVIPRSPARHQEGESKMIGVADEHIGAVVGRGGRNIFEISQVSGASIKISDRGEFISGTSERKVTIFGSPESIRTAEAMIMQKVSSNSENRTSMQAD